MNKSLITLSFLISFCAGAQAQINDSSIERLVLTNALSCDDISYNSIILIPELYREHKMDTIHAIISYWTRKCGLPEPVASFEIINGIKNRTFTEKIFRYKSDGAADSSFDYYKNNILYYLQWYRYGYHIRTKPGRYSPENTAEYIISAYDDYYQFLAHMASELRDQSGLTPLDHFLASYFARPTPRLLDELKSTAYDSTALKAAYKKDREISGLQVAMTSGIWMPQGSLSIVRSQPYFGITLGTRQNKFMFDVNLTFRFSNTTKDYTTIYDQDSIFKGTYTNGGYIGADLGFQLFRKYKNELDLLGGAGLDLTTLTYDVSTLYTFRSFNLNVGLGYKLFLRNIQTMRASRNSYLALQVKYNFLNYNNPGGSDFTGNAYTVGLVYGLYKHTRHPGNVRW